MFPDLRVVSVKSLVARETLRHRHQNRHESFERRGAGGGGRDKRDCEKNMTIAMRGEKVA